MEQLTEASPPIAKDAPGLLELVAAKVTGWSERWFPDAYIFATIAVVVVAIGALAIGAPIKSVGIAFGDGFWTLIPFTMQLAVAAITGYVVAESPLASKAITWLARLPTRGNSAIAFVALVSIVASLFNWAISLFFSGLLVRALARRTDLRMDYRAAGAAAYLGLGATWALGLSSAASQLQANPASLPKPLLAITGVIPFPETILLPQSMLLAAVLLVVSVGLSYFSAPRGDRVRTAADLGVPVDDANIKLPSPDRPGDWLEYSPIITILMVLLGSIWVWNEFSTKNPILAISNLNTYNFVFVLIAMLLSWRPRRFLNAVAKSIPSIAGMIVQFPLYGGIAFIITKATGSSGGSLSEYLSQFFVAISSHASFPALMGIYSAVLGFFVPSGGGKWIIEAPYVIEAAKTLQVHLGWAVTVYNAAEALPNLINPFWMLPLLGILGLKARDIVGFTFTQLLVHFPLVIFMLWILGGTLVYHPPVMP
ncbi:TIGR00366 family protein [Caballeronia sp. SEWSISQ10-4 2]|uniref:short-chain fatty acid transporter n=1 Tax=Caballeronia sp. SEWSISQ10-4 2 TaxID=2937438 RepID=UPI00265720E9|nr:TIGR00366 family protein [Caballeronia sp. SEWSISQ10-4 2]MDN7177292.1 TIGR00366 family protein [Caballeronia sp. SEWSISQ10-4 2]